MGKQLSTELNVKPSIKSENDDRHLAHCAFCSNPPTQDAIPNTIPFIIQVLAAQAWQVIASAVTPVYQHLELLPPSQGPPNS